MKTKILTQLFFVAIASISLCSCTADSVTDSTQKTNLLPKVSTHKANDITSVVEPIIIKPKR